jgi:hypothetical protein
MSRFRSFALGLAVIAGAAIATANVAAAQPIRTYVALTGSDSNPCTFALPCKSAQHAHDVVAAGGEMRMLDAGSFGLITITKAISILGDGHGGVAAQNGASAITINAGANDRINLRGLVIEGFASGNIGIDFNTGRTLDIQDCIVRNFNGQGIFFLAPASSTLLVANTHISGTRTGIEVTAGGSGSNTVVATFSHIWVQDSLEDGVSILSNSPLSAISAAIDDSVITANTDTGVEVANATSGSANLTVRNSLISNNGVGVAAGGSHGLAIVARSTIVTNGTALQTGALGSPGGVIQSMGDNNLFGNGTQGAFSGTTPPQ